MLLVCQSVGPAGYWLSMVPLVGVLVLPLVGLAGAWLLKVFTFRTVVYLANRALLIAVVMGLGPIVIFKGLALMMKFTATYGQDLMSYLLSSTGLESPVVGLWGVGGYLAGLLRVAEGISLYLSWLLLKVYWKLMPKF